MADAAKSPGLLLLHLLVWMLIGGGVVVPGVARADAGSLREHLAALLRTYADRGEFSGVACTFDDTPETTEVAVGVSDAHAGTPLATDSLFRIGSLSKTVVALILLRMSEEGSFALDHSAAPVISEVLGHAPRCVERVPTYWELMHHTSGLEDPCPFWLPVLVGEDRRVSTARELLPLGLRAAQVTAPGERFEYANVNYALLTEAIRLRTGGSYESAVSAFVAGPLGLEALGVNPEGDQRARMSQGHFSVLGHLVTRKEVLGTVPDAYRDAAGSGNLFASCRDFAALLRGAAWGPLFRYNATRRKWLEVGLDDYAAGVAIESRSGHTVVRNAGAVPGFTGLFEVYPEARRGVVVLANLDVSDLPEASLARSVRALVLADAGAPPPERDGAGGPGTGPSGILGVLRLGLHASLAPTVWGRAIQVLVVALLAASFVWKQGRHRLGVLADITGAVGLVLVLGALSEMGLGLVLLLLAVVGLGAGSLLSRSRRLPWLPPRGTQRGVAALELLLAALFLGLGILWSALPPCSWYTR